MEVLSVQLFGREASPGCGEEYQDLESTVPLRIDLLHNRTPLLGQCSAAHAHGGSKESELLGGAPARNHQ